MYNFLFVAIGFLFDLIVQAIFPVDFAYQTIFFVPCFSFISLLLVTRRMTLYSSVLFAVILGLFQDIVSGQAIFVYPLIYVICVLIYAYWSKNLSETIFEMMLLILVMIFVKEILVYGYHLMMGLTEMFIMTFLIKRCFLSVVIGLAEGLIMIGTNYLFQGKIDREKAYHDQNDNLFGHQFK